jgi:hypothetical protein
VYTQASMQLIKAHQNYHLSSRKEERPKRHLGGGGWMMDQWRCSRDGCDEFWERFELKSCLK